MLDELIKLANPNPIISYIKPKQEKKSESNYQIVAYRTTPNFKVTIPFYIKCAEVGNEWDTETVGNGSRKFTPAWTLLRHLKRINQIDAIRIMTSNNLDELKATCNNYIATYKKHGGCWLNTAYYETTATSLEALIPEVTDSEKNVFNLISIKAKIILADKLNQQKRSQKSNKKSTLKNTLTPYQESQETVQDFMTFENSSHKNHPDLID